MGQDSIAVGQGEGETVAASTHIGLSAVDLHTEVNIIFNAKYNSHYSTGCVKTWNHPKYRSTFECFWDLRKNILS